MNALKVGMIGLILGLTGCATAENKPEPFSGLCAIQPIASQDGVMLAAVQRQQ